MAINKIEYKLDSLTAGLASAGDEVTILKSNAVDIEKDVEAGNTQELTSAQDKYLQHLVESADSTDYETEGEESIEDEEGEGGEKEGEENNGESGATAGAVGGLLFGQAVLAGTAALMGTMNNYTAPFNGAAALMLATASLTNVTTFDSDLNDRKAEKQAANEYMESIYENIEILQEDIDSLNDAISQISSPAADAAEGATEGGEGGGEEGGGEEGGGEGKDTSILGRLISLKDEIDAADKEGDTEKAQQLREERDSIIEGLNLGENSEGGGLALDDVATNNTAAHELLDYTTEVSSFLKEGNKLGAIGIVNSVQLAASAALSFTLAPVMSWVGAFWLDPTAPVRAAIGTGLGVAAGAMFSAGSMMMIGKSVEEFSIGAKGSELLETIKEMEDPMAEHDKLADAVGAFEEEEPEAAAEDVIDETKPDAGEGTPSGNGATDGAASAGGEGGSSASSSSGSGSSNGGES